MEKKLYEEMIENVNKVDQEMHLINRMIFLFGHCSATLELIDLLESEGLGVVAILDNNDAKYGLEYKGVKVIKPGQVAECVEMSSEKESIVLITSRFYASMVQQLRTLGYKGPVRKVIDYNTYAEYSLSDDTIKRMQARVKHGDDLRFELSNKYDRYFTVFCPFNALGDIYFMIAYWPAYAKSREIGKAVFCVPSRVLGDVIHMFGDYPVEVYEQKELDAMIQSAIYSKDQNSFIAHQDRPYVVNLNKALYVKKIPLEQIYCCGVYGLPVDTEPAKPAAEKWMSKNIVDIPRGRSVIFSPYAKSVPAIDTKIWKEAVAFYAKEGYQCFTNVVGTEVPIEGTLPVSPSILEMRSVIEQAGIFIGIRSGLCDIIREAKAKKVALYPDYYYSDTKWKAIEIYYINQFDYNLLATEEIQWEKL